ncbi:DUF2249 domain-containing protein [Evansella clarkii]|jgi:uncharacterized protein (DUF2249 family)|uniref:DUF2249 domain-containing protein n=1 Tax=Evansella clarkii TaxID=79879 RepID=UPI00099772D5|nr:DUF2249 domain-containing protein [Evansella clarkii]
MTIVNLDVRKDLENKKDPFKKIMNTVKALKKDEKLVLHSTIKPVPLLTIMKAKGYTNKVEKIAADHYRTIFEKNKEGLIKSIFKRKKKEETPAPVHGAPAFPTNENLLKDEEKGAFFLDNRGLEPPQPMVRTLKRLESLKVSETLTIHNDRVPVYLLEELKNLGVNYTIEEQPDGSAKVHLTRTDE